MHVESDLGITRIPGGDGGEVEKVFDIFKEEEINYVNTTLTFLR